jgi:predicted phosphodiesterase
VLVIGDVHAPFEDEKALNQVIDERAPGKDLVIQVGDLTDLYNYSKYTRNPNLITPKQEVEQARAHAEKAWARIRKRNRKAKCVLLRGNHDARVDKRVSENLPELGALVGSTIRDFFTFDGVETIHDPTEEFIVTVNGERVAFMHGHRSKLGDHASYNRISTVCGHSHTGGVVFFRDRRRTFWELNAGWFGKESHPVFAYGAQKQIRKWTMGYGEIDHRGPRFVPISRRRG